MKKRIIAALTAIVMVVTMIPANAFAANTDYNVADVVNLIEEKIDKANDYAAIVYGDANVAKNLKAARDAYNRLSDNQKNEMSVNHGDTVKSLIAAEKYYAYQVEVVTEYNNAVAKVAKESLNALATGSNLDVYKNAEKDLSKEKRVITNVETAYKKLAETIYVSVKDEKASVSTTASGNDVISNKTLALAAKVNGDGTNTADTTIEYILGADMNTADTTFAGAVNKVNAITPEIVEKLDAKEIEGNGTAYQAYVAAGKAIYNNFGKTNATSKKFATDKDVAKYIDLAKGYNNFKAAMDKVNGTELKDVAEANKKIEAYAQEFEKTANIAPVNEGNIALAKVALADAEKVYNKYKDNAEYAERAGVVALGDAIKATKENIKLYDAAKKVEAYINGFFTDADHTKYRTIEYKDKLAMERIVAESAQADTALGKFADNTNAPLEHIAKFLAKSTATVSLNKVKADYDKVQDEVERVFDQHSTKDLLDLYGKQIKELIGKISNRNSVSYMNDGENIIKVLDLFGELDTLADSHGLTEIIDLGTQTGTDAERIAAAGSEVDASTTTISTFSKYFADNYVSDAVFVEFLAKCKIVSTELAKDTTAVQSLTDALPQMNEEKPIKDSNEAFEARKRFNEFNDTKAKLTEQGKYLYNEYWKSKNAPTEYTEASALKKQEAYINAWTYQNDDAVLKNVKNVISEIKDRVYVKADFLGKPLPADKLAITKDAISKVDELLKDKAVKTVFEGLQTTTATYNGGVVLEEYKKDLTAATFKYAYEDEMKKLALAKKEIADAESSVNPTVAEVIAAIDALKLDADLEANLIEYNVVKTKFDALTNAQKAAVTNAADLNVAANKVAKQAVAVIEKEMDKIVVVTDPLTDELVATVNGITALLTRYESVLTDVNAYNAKYNTNIDLMFNTPFDTTHKGVKDYHKALGILHKLAVKKAITEEIAPMYVEFYETAEKTFDLTKLTAKDALKIMTNIERYNGLSEVAKDKIVDLQADDLRAIEKKLNIKDNSLTATTKAKVQALLEAGKVAKALILDYATVEKIEDQVYTGEAITPVIVVKDANGKVIDNAKLDLTYTNNVEEGVATIVIIPAGEEFAGRLEVNFNIVKKDEPVVEPVVPTGLKVVATDHGIIKVAVDKVEAEGLTYKFFVKRVGDERWTASKETASNEMVFRGLKKNQKYQVKAVTIVNNKASEEALMDGTVWTNRKGNKSSFMYKPVINKVTINKGVAKITVKEFNYNDIKYAVGYKKAGASKYTWLKYTTRTVKTVKNLKKGVKYSFKVKYNYISEVSGKTVVSTKWSDAVTKVAR